MLSVKAMRDENNRLSEKLNSEYAKIYIDFVCYLRVSALSEKQQEDVCSDVLEIFFDWQAKGKTANEMVVDYKKFADDIIAAINPKRNLLSIIKEYAPLILDVFGFMLTIDFVFLYLPKIISGNNPSTYDYSLSQFVRNLLIFTVAVGIVTYIGKNSFSLSKKKTVKKTTRFYKGFLIGSTIMFFISTIFILLNKIDNIILFSFSMVLTIRIIIVFWIYKTIYNVINVYSTFNSKSVKKNHPSNKTLL